MAAMRAATSSSAAASAPAGSALLVSSLVDVNGDGVCFRSSSRSVKQGTACPGFGRWRPIAEPSHN